MMRPVVILSFAALLTLAACGDDGGTGSDAATGPDSDVVDVTDAGDAAGGDVTPDVPPDGSGPGDVDGGSNDDGGPVDADPTDADPTDTDQDVEVPVDPAVDFWFDDGAGGAKGQGTDTVALYPEDEPTAYQAIAGFQTNLVVDIVGAETGDQLTLTVDGTAFGGQAIVVVDQHATITFGGQSLPEAPAGLSVTVAVTGKPELAVTKTVSVATVPCVVTVAPGEGSCASVDADDSTEGFDVAVHVEVEGGAACDLAHITWQLGAQGEVTDLDPAALVDGAADLTIEVAEADAQVAETLWVTVVATHPASAALDSAPVVRGLSVDNVPPQLAFTLPDGEIVAALALGDDQDGDPTNGIQFDVNGASEGLEDDAQVTLWIGGEQAGVASVSGGLFAFPEVTLEGSGSITLELTADDACGNSGSGQVAIDVFSVQPTLGITKPLAGAVLLAKGDGDPSTGLVYELAVTVASAGLVDGAQVSVECQGASDAGYVTVGSGTWTAAAGLEPVPVALDVALLGTALSCRATASGPNPVTSADVDVTVALPGPSLSLSAPATGASLNTKVVTFQGEGTGLDGQSIAVAVAQGGNLACELNAGTVVSGAYDFALDLDTACGGLADGTYTLTVDAADAWGNVVSELQAAPFATVTFDTLPPSVERVAPAAHVLDPVVDAGAADQSGVPGYQTTFTYVASGEASLAGTTICFTLRGQLVSCKAVDPLSGTATWTGVTLLPGANAAEAQAVDAFGNGSDVLAEVVTLVLDAPVVDFVAPAADVVVSDGEIDVVVFVSAQDSGAGIDAATVTLLIDGADSGVAPVNTGDGVYTFANVPLTEDTQVGLQAVASFAGQEGASGIRLVTWKTTHPAVSVTSPADGEVFSLSSGACIGSGADCLTSITATVSNAEPGSEVNLTVTCQGTTVELSATYSGGDIVFPGVTLKHGGTCALTPSVTDAAQQTVVGDVVTVTVDRVAPKVVSFVSPAGNQLINYDDVQAGTPGMQHPLQVRIGGVEAGQVVTVTMEWTDNETLEPLSAVFQHTTTAASSDAGTYTASFASPPGGGVVTYGTASQTFEGNVTLTATVVDAALNTASAGKVLFVKPVAPSVRITAPSYVSGQACTPGSCQTGLCHQGSCWTAWGLLTARQMLIAVNGLLSDSDNLRICSDHPSLAAGGSPCASEGYYEVAVTDAPADGSHFVVFDDTDLPEGFQVLVAEIQPEAGGPWFSSLDAPAPADQRRQLFVDVTPPVVSSISSPSDVQPPFGVLNLAEQAASGRIYSVRVEASEDGSAGVYLKGAKVADVDIDSGVAVFQLGLDEGDNDLYVRVMDFAGNLSVGATNPSLVTFDVTVDTALPTLNFVSPDASPLVMGDSLDVVLSSSKDGSQVTLFDAGASIGTLPVVAGQAVFDDATYGVLSQGSHTLTATVVGPSGNENSAATSPTTIDVDTLPPSGTIVSPVAGTELLEGDDADPGAGGYQLAVEFDTADGAEDWTLSLAYGCDDAYANCGPATQVATGSVTNPGGAEPTELIDVAVTETPAHTRVILVTHDGVGNTATHVVGVTFTLDCVIALTDLIDGSWYNGNLCDGGAPCATANITLTGEFFGPCGGVDELRLVDGPTLLGVDSQVDDNLGTFDVTLTDGATIAFELKAFAGGAEVGSSGASVRKVDLSPPDVSFVAADVGGFITPAEGSSALYNAADDVSSGIAGFQGHARITIVDDNAKGGEVVALEATTDGATVDLDPSNTTLPSAIVANSPVTHTFQDLTYPDQATTTVTVTVTDAAGNASTSSFDATVDTVAPGAVVLDEILATDVNARLPSVTLHWTAVADNGVSGATAATYDVRYSRNPIGSEAEFEAACPVAGASGLLHSPAFPAPGAPGAAEVYTVSGPDPRPESVLVGGQPCKLASTLPGDGEAGQELHFAARVADAAGNWSPVSPSVSTTDLVYERTRVRFTSAFVAATGIASFFKDIITVGLTATGDLDGDGIDDFAVGHFVPDVVCWFRGGALGDEYAVDDLSGPGHECIVGAASAVPGGVQIASYLDGLGDVNGDGFMDLGASGKISATGKGFLAVFLGSESAGPDLTAPDVLILGADGITGPPYFNWCGAGDFTGDGLADIGVGEPSADALHVVPGSATWVAGQGGAGNQVVLDLDAPGDLAAASVITLLADFGTSATFGEKCRASGDILPTPGGGAAASDLLVLQSSNVDARLFLIPGRAATPGVNDTVTVSEKANVEPILSGDPDSVRLRQDLIDGFAVAGWGSAFQGDQDLTGDGIPDVLVTHGARSTHNGDGKAIWIFDGAALAAGTGGDIRVSVQGGLVGKGWIGLNGYVLQADISNFFRGVRVVGNFDGWLLDGVSTPDLWIANNQKTAIQMRANHEDDGGAAQLGQFPYAEGSLANPDPALAGVGNSLGLNIDGGTDLTGDSLPDIIIGTQKGEILLIH